MQILYNVFVLKGAIDMSELILSPAYDDRDKEDIVALFKEYTDMLVENDKRFAVYLEIQNYDEEIKDLRVKYGEPYGRLYIARVDGAPVGCVAMKKHDDENAGELKRLYIRPEYRGRGYSRIMAEKILADAKAIGYEAVYLDTLPFLKAAKHLYDKLGFVECPPYNSDPMGCSIFMCRRFE